MSFPPPTVLAVISVGARPLWEASLGFLLGRAVRLKPLLVSNEHPPVTRKSSRCSSACRGVDAHLGNKNRSLHACTCVRRLASTVSWTLLWWVARDERGVVGRETLRSCYDGTLFYKIAERRRAQSLASKYE